VRSTVWCGLATLALVAACGSRAEEARFTWVRRADTASVAFPGAALWCAGPAWLELFAGSNDTGVAVAVFTRDSVLEGRFPILPVGERDDSLRPMASLAVRWFSETELLAFEGRSGTVELAMADDGLTARLTGHLMVLTDDDTLDLTGSFPALRVVRGGPGCPAAGDSSSAMLD